MSEKWSQKGASQDGMSHKRETIGDGYQHEGFKSWIIDTVDRYFPKGGDIGVPVQNCVRIVQPLEVDELDYYGMVAYYHRNVGVDSAQVLCLKRMLKQRDPICELQTDDLWKTDHDKAKSYYPSDGVIMWVHDLFAETEEEVAKLKLWACPTTLAEEFLAQSNKPGTSVYIDVSHPETGMPVYFTRTKTGKEAYKVEYGSVQIDFDNPMPLSDATADQRVPFWDCIVLYTYEEIYEMFHGALTDAEVVGEPSDSTKVPIGGIVCWECGAEVFDTPSGTVCTNGHGAAETATIDEWNEWATVEAPDRVIQQATEPPVTEEEFVSEWLETVCAGCGLPLFTTVNGHICENSHENLEAITPEEYEAKKAPPKKMSPKKAPAPKSAPAPKKVVAKKEAPAKEAAGLPGKKPMGKVMKSTAKVGAPGADPTSVKAKLAAAIAKHKAAGG